ncbi:hypothetical protein FAGKG844_140063 [Frankia sp. AgKG'84/4]
MTKGDLRRSPLFPDENSEIADVQVRHQGTRLLYGAAGSTAAAGSRRRGPVTTGTDRPLGLGVRNSCESGTTRARNNAASTESTIRRAANSGKRSS